MKVCIIIPQVAGLVEGGVRRQAFLTAQHLSGDSVETVCYNPWDPPDWNTINLVHLFQANYTTLQISRILADYHLPYVISPVTYTNHSERFVRLSRKLEQLGRPLLKGMTSLYDVIHEICSQSALVLPNTTAEGALIKNGYEIPAHKITVIPNGVESLFSHASAQPFIKKFGFENFILYVGNIGTERKNAYRLLQAMAEIDAPSVLIGPVHNNTYGKKCLELAKQHDHIHLLGVLPHNSKYLASAYAAARLFILPGMFETPGIAALEAALAGTPVAITKYGGTKDYFKDEAIYLEPTSITSIKQAILKGLKSPEPTRLKQTILDNYTWQHVAKSTLKAYKSVLT